MNREPLWNDEDIIITAIICGSIFMMGIVLALVKIL